MGHIQCHQYVCNVSGMPHPSTRTSVHGAINFHMKKLLLPSQDQTVPFKIIHRLTNKDPFVLLPATASLRAQEPHRHPPPLDAQEQSVLPKCTRSYFSWASPFTFSLEQSDVSLAIGHENSITVTATPTIILKMLDLRRCIDGIATRRDDSE